jgi:diguanylate cyclase (GGDEF)-like protein
MLNAETAPADDGGLGHRVRIELSTRLLSEKRSAQFPPELEAEYLRFHGERILSLLRLALGLVPVLYLFIFAIDACFSRQLQTPLAMVLSFGVGVPSSIALFLIVRAPKRQSLAARVAPWCNLANGLVVVILCAVSTAHQQSFHYELIALVFAYTFFLGGLRPQSAFLIALAIISSYGFAEALAGLATETLAWHLYFLGTLAGLGTLGSMMMDRSQRRFWLQRLLTTELSISDGLTGLHNHRYLKEQGDSVLRHAARELRSVALLLIDVDNFKSYNDTQGHLAGDECLRRLGLLIEATGRRPLDIAARYGGEEFAVLMYDCVEPQAQRRAQELCDEIARLRITHPSSPIGHVSVSIGVSAGIPQLTSEIEAFTRMADLALYAAKAKGRNRVECSSLVS